MKKRIQMNDSIKDFFKDISNLPNMIEVKGSKYYPKKFISDEGYKSVVLEGVDIYGDSAVIKIATYEDYLDRSFLEEASRSAKLRNYSQFANFYDADINKFDIDGKKQKFICFIEEKVEGETLDTFIKNHQINSPFIINYVKQMCDVLNILKTKNLRHDDLHLKNIMISPPKSGILSKEYTVKVIDMGSLKDFNSPLKKEKDDFGRFTEHLVELYNSMLLDNNGNRKSLTLSERKFRKEMILLLESMVEEDNQIALRNPSNIVSKFEHAFIRSKGLERDFEMKLEDPFDYISAEHISSDNLLMRLFADSCPWEKEVISPNPILLTGPRGCGKSMLFRRLSLKAMLFKNPEEIKEMPIAGFYVSCSSNFRNRFGYITSEPLIKKFRNEIIHYFNLLIIHGIVQSLLLISKRNDRENLFGFGEIQEKELHDYVLNLLDISEERRLRLQGVKPIEHLLEIIESEMSLCYDYFLKRKKLNYFTSFSFISDITKFLSKNIEYFKKRTITFLIDDYSIHRISEQIQIVLNPILWDRQSTHIFKISAEKYGAQNLIDNIDSSSPTADITREFREIDCGRYYINLSDKDKMSDLVNFSEEILNHRLNLSDYSGTAKELIGHSKYPNGSLSEYLRNRPKKRNHYHGLETISEICSGDISALLEIYRRIFQEGKIEKTTTNTIPKTIQHKAIRSVSGNFLSLVKSYHPYGTEMNDILTNFGTLCRKILNQGKFQRLKTNKEYKKVINETTRIEVDQIPDKNEEWTPYQEQLIKELVRRSIFIEMEPGRGRHTSGPTLRWQMRRIYCPEFGTSMKKNTAIKWYTSDFKYFLLNPKQKCKEEFKKWSSKKEKKDSDVQSYLDV